VCLHFVEVRRQLLSHAGYAPLWYFGHLLVHERAAQLVHVPENTVIKLQRPGNSGGSTPVYPG
jgi:hypothetical protein